MDLGPHEEMCQWNEARQGIKTSLCTFEEAGSSRRNSPQSTQQEIKKESDLWRQPETSQLVLFLFFLGLCERVFLAESKPKFRVSTRLILQQIYVYDGAFNRHCPPPPSCHFLRLTDARRAATRSARVRFRREGTRRSNGSLLKEG